MHCINLWIGTFSRCSRKMLYLSTTAELNGATNPDAGIVCPTGFVKKLAEGVVYAPILSLSDPGHKGRFAPSDERFCLSRTAPSTSSRERSYPGSTCCCAQRQSENFTE